MHGAQMALGLMMPIFNMLDIQNNPIIIVQLKLEDQVLPKLMPLVVNHNRPRSHA